MPPGPDCCLVGLCFNTETFGSLQALVLCVGSASETRGLTESPSRALLFIMASSDSHVLRTIQSHRPCVPGTINHLSACLCDSHSHSWYMHVYTGLCTHTHNNNITDHVNKCTIHLCFKLQS